ncbi:MAG: ferrous iron transport protein A [Prevotella sp.]|nr:ferrous iron transport protein A [Prevotella sp.]
MTLNELSVGEKGIIKKLNVTGIDKKRWQDLGFLPNTEIECLWPNTYRLRGSNCTLSTVNAKQIEIDVILI